MSVCESVRDVIDNALTAAGRKVGSRLIAVGGAAIDLTDCNGMLIVGIERTFQARTPFPTTASTSDSELIGVDLLVLVARCVPVVDEHGAAPSVDEQQSAHGPVLADSALVWSICKTATFGTDLYGDTWERGPVSQDFVGPEGGVVLVATRFALGLPIDEWCTA